MGDVVFALVVAARFLVPLLIPKFPLPAIVAALVIDAADQTVFAAFGVEPANYQGYDKALDIFYLSVAYISTIRNWTDGYAFRIGQFLWYYRLVGVLLFESIGWRPLLLIFPNTFEYFFIAYEAIRLCWAPRRLSHHNLLGMAAAIWIFIKLPQETWIHILKLDFTEALDNHPWFGPTILVVLATAAALGWMYRSRIPATDWPPSVYVDAHPTTVRFEPADVPTRGLVLLNHPLIEKTALISLVSIIFSKILPEYQGSAIGLTVAVAVIIVCNSIGTIWLVNRGATWVSAGAHFFVMLVLNLGIVLMIEIVLGDGLAGQMTLFFLVLLSLMSALYDRFRAERLPWSKLASAIRRTALA